jgi:hypothetical protein
MLGISRTTYHSSSNKHKGLASAIRAGSFSEGHSETLA